MEPKEIQLGIISENKLYIAYYNFSDKSWKIDETTKDVDVWSNKEIAKKLPKIEEDHHVVITDDEDEFEIYAYGISEDMFNQYVEELKEAGYEEDTASKSHFESKSLDGNIIDAWYYEEDSRLSISIEKE